MAKINIRNEGHGNIEVKAPITSCVCLLAGEQSGPTKKTLAPGEFLEIPIRISRHSPTTWRETVWIPIRQNGEDQKLDLDFYVIGSTGEVTDSINVTPSRLDFGSLPFDETSPPQRRVRIETLKLAHYDQMKLAAPPWIEIHQSESAANSTTLEYTVTPILSKLRVGENSDTVEAFLSSDKTAPLLLPVRAALQPPVVMEPIAPRFQQLTTSGDVETFIQIYPIVAEPTKLEVDDIDLPDGWSWERSHPRSVDPHEQHWFRISGSFRAANALSFSAILRGHYMERPFTMELPFRELRDP